MFQVAGANIYVTAPEDLILSKLHWTRATSSELHCRDVKAILDSGVELDYPYL